MRMTNDNWDLGTMNWNLRSGLRRKEESKLRVGVGVRIRVERRGVGGVKVVNRTCDKPLNALWHHTQSMHHWPADEFAARHINAANGQSFMPGFSFIMCKTWGIRAPSATSGRQHASFRFNTQFHLKCDKRCHCYKSMLRQSPNSGQKREHLAYKREKNSWVREREGGSRGGNEGKSVSLREREHSRVA